MLPVPIQLWMQRMLKMKHRCEAIQLQQTKIRQHDKLILQQHQIKPGLKLIFCSTISMLL